jgi:3-dehydrotetronate 4-kinase
MRLALGAIADDFTGALDLANNLARAGLRTVQLNGVPGADADIGDAQAVVVALKSRTAPVDGAVRNSTAALDWLRERGASKTYVKYCSTFDSTPAGNIGPVVDAVLDRLGEHITIVVPTFPGTGRTVYQGHLFVGGELLDESSMRHHPLTPMTDSSVIRLLRPQTRRRVSLITHDTVRQGHVAVAEELARIAADGGGLVVVDAICDDDLAVVAVAARDLPVVTGGSGLAQHLPAAWQLELSPSAADLPGPAGAGAVLAGSVSRATNQQVAAYEGPKRALQPHALLDGPAHLDEILHWAYGQIDSGATPLLYSSASPEAVARAAEISGGRAAEAVEHALARAARMLVDCAGVRRLVVAGGETSGACVEALGIQSLRVGPQIDPGVAWAWGETPAGGVHIALKSGNFGRTDFFRAAFETLQ